MGESIGRSKGVRSGDASQRREQRLGKPKGETERAVGLFIARLFGIAASCQVGRQSSRLSPPRLLCFHLLPGQYFNALEMGRILFRPHSAGPASEDRWIAGARLVLTLRCHFVLRFTTSPLFFSPILSVRIIVRALICFVPVAAQRVPGV